MRDTSHLDGDSARRMIRIDAIERQALRNPRVTQPQEANLAPWLELEVDEWTAMQRRKEEQHQQQAREHGGVDEARSPEEQIGA